MGSPVFLPPKDSKSREQLPRKASLLGKPACDSAWRAPLAGWKCELIRWISGLRGLSVCFAAAARVPWESRIRKRANFDKSRAETLSSLQYSFIPLPACKSSALVFGWKGIFLPLQKLPFFCSPWEAVKIIFVVFWKERIPDKAKGLKELVEGVS